MADIKNELNWSHSRASCLAACPRQYYYSHYLMWNGWDYKASEAQRDAYRLKQMKTVPLLAGDITHQVIRAILCSYRDAGQIITCNQALTKARGLWQQHLDESLSGGWRTQPKRVTCLFEDYYEQSDRNSKVEEGWWCIETCITNFLECQTWVNLQKSNPSRWLLVDDANFSENRVQVDSVPCFMMLDFGFEVKSTDPQQRKCRIFDWKTGKKRRSDEAQIAYYAIFAMNKWGFDSFQVLPRLVYLQEYEELDVPIDDLKIDEAKSQIRVSYAKMLNQVDDIFANVPKDISYFPVTTEAFRCRNCSYQEICNDSPSVKA